jgi:3-deoxy-manno-octulosonate cytidylyltransferase (CMP-KDO synthetase)
MNIIGIIPARMGSSRFPGKPMEEIHGMPMIGHCYLRAKLCDQLTDVYVATCDAVIFDYIIGLGGNAVMTSPDHDRASDRAAEAMEIIEHQLNSKVDCVVMIQGDEPMITPNMISSAVQPILEEGCTDVINLMTPIKTITEFEDPNEVKVVVDSNSNALYFSREPIPSRKKGMTEVPMLKQVCIIPFLRDGLLKFNATPQTPLEIIESVDMMRVLEVGEKVKMIMITEECYSVDTRADLDKVIVAMADDVLMPIYLVE